MSKRNGGNWVRIASRPLRRILGRLVGRGPGAERSRPRTPDDRSIAWLWPYLARTVSRRHAPRYERPDALVLQAGRVASLSIQQAMWERGYNAFHSHGFSVECRRRSLACLESTTRRVTHGTAMRSHVAEVAHNELVQWYRTHRRRNEQPLRVISLIRDPATWLASHIVLLKHRTVPIACRWYALETGAPADHVNAIDAMEAFGRMLGRLILEIQPSRDLTGAMSALSRIARERWPAVAGFGGLLAGGLNCARWFDREMLPVFGVDALAWKSLAAEGIARHSVDYADILVVRFEDLAAKSKDIAEFLCRPEFSLPHLNATDGTGDRAALRAALEAGLEAAGGEAVRRELRTTRYGIAGGYDSMYR